MTMSPVEVLLPGFTAPVPYTGEQVEAAPREPGVHAVLDADGNVLYVGETGDLRSRIRQHLQGDRQASVLHEQVGELLDGDRHAEATEISDWLSRCTVFWRVTGERAAVKASLIAAHLPRFNRNTRDPFRWYELLHWAAKFVASVDLDDEERDYKIAAADTLAAARRAAEANEVDWVQRLKQALDAGNFAHYVSITKLLDWAVVDPEPAKTHFSALWDNQYAVLPAVDTFRSALPSSMNDPGTSLELAASLLMSRDPHRYPPYRKTTFDNAYRITGWPHNSSGPSSELYVEALTFLDAFGNQCRSKRIALRDRLDAQGLLFRTLSNAPPTWSDDDKRAHEQFLKGTAVDTLANLVAQFRTETGYPRQGRPERQAERADLAAALTPEALDEPEVRTLRRLAGPAYGSPGPQPGFNQLLQTDGGVHQVRETLQHLLYGPGEVEDRLTECISGGRKLPKVGEAVMVKCFAVCHPERWFPCYVTTGKVGKRRILQLLGNELADYGSVGTIAARSNDQIRKQLDPHFPDDPWGMQEFSWWLLHREHVPEQPLDEVSATLHLPTKFLADIVELLHDKGQVVFYGPPGTGKTYVARALADHIARGGGVVEKIQFHPSYAYEDFVEGYRPQVSDGQVRYELVNGPLKRIAELAELRPDVTHVLLIDELNRAHVSKVLGELLYLLEYRDEEIRLQYSDTPFALPENLLIIATMNTADRSVALVDAALRRRFHFVPFFPQEEPINGLLRSWLLEHNPEMLWVADLVDRANALLADRNLAIGPSHFLTKKLDESVARKRWKHSVIPLLEEYFFSDPAQLTKFDFDRLRAGSAQTPSAVGDETVP